MKRTWIAPTVTEYGSIEQVTLQIKNKVLGLCDDFGVPGVQDPTS